MQDPASVHSSWNAYFKQVENNVPPGAAFQSPPSLASSAVYQVQGSAAPAATAASSADVSTEVNKYLAVENLIRAYQVWKLLQCHICDGQCNIIVWLGPRTLQSKP